MENLITFSTPQNLVLYSIAIFAIGLLLGIWLTTRIVKTTQNNYLIK